MSLYNLSKCDNKKIQFLAKQIQKEQSECEHNYGPEWQEYNIYNKRCSKCAFVHSVEYQEELFMNKLYIWEVSTMLDSTMTSMSYPITFKVVTDDKSFAKAESTAITHVSELMTTRDYDNKTWCGYLSNVNYVDHAMTMSTEETDG